MLDGKDNKMTEWQLVRAAVDSALALIRHRGLQFSQPKPYPPDAPFDLIVCMDNAWGIYLLCLLITNDPQQCWDDYCDQVERCIKQHGG